VGNMIGASLWTAVFVGRVVLMIFLFTRIFEEDGKRKIRNPNFKWLLLNPDGRLSLSKTQVAVWTLCIGVTVFIFGMTRLAPPVIPETLVALMGLSLGTRVITYTKEKSDMDKADPKLSQPEPKSNEPDPKLSDLVKSKVGGKYDLSITKAQMLYWTCLKSLLDGELWDVPWQLVALMGISQATYIVPVVNPKDGKSQEQTGQQEQSRTAIDRPPAVTPPPGANPPSTAPPSGK